ncbi:MAG: hypothetical protein IKF82_00310 [Bacilli bacterium]|nr:hypothetical protein [Bacilli bacterium]
MKYNKKQLINACNQALKGNVDLNTESAMYTDVENRIHLGGDDRANWRSF